MAQDIQVLGKRNEKDKLKNINLTRSVRLNDLTQEELAKLYRRGKTNATTGSLNNGFKFDYLFESNAYNVALDVVAITFHSSPDAVVFDCGYSAFYDRFFEVLLSETPDGSYSLSQWISKVPWLTSDELKTVNGQSLVGTGDIEIAAGVESLNGQTGNISLKTVNGNELIGTGDIEIKGGGDETPTGTTLYFTTTDGQTLNANIEAKNKAGTVIEPSLKTPTAWYYDEIVETMGFPAKTTNCNLYSLNGVNIPVGKMINNYYTNSVIRNIMQNCRYADLRKFFFSGYNRELSTMFWEAKNLEWVDIPNLNTYNTTKMDKMFYDCSGLITLDVSNWNTSQVTDMSDMFHGCSSLTSLDVSNWNTSKVKDMDNMFLGCRSLTYLDVSHFDVSQIKYMSSIFQGCKSLTYLDVSKWDTSKFIYMKSIFTFCSALTSLDLSNWNTSQVTDMSDMFHGCSGLTSLDLSNFNTLQVTNMQGMFSECGHLASLDLSNWNLTNVTSMGSMFWMDYALKTITMKNCSQETIDKIKSALTDAGILDKVQIITA